MDFEDLTPEQREKACACKTPEEFFALAKEEGFELTEKELEAVSGGSICWSQCPNVEKCKKHDECRNYGWD